MYRDNTKVVHIGDVAIGGGNPVAIQSMTNTKTEDVAATVAQIHSLEDLGCDIIRCAVPTMEAAEALEQIKKQIRIPLVADIHFDYRLAIAAMEHGADKIRINPGNIGDNDRVRAVVDVAKERNIPIRVGVNSGSLEKEYIQEYGGVTAEGIVRSALGKVKLIEDMGYDNLVISIKSSDVLMCVKAHELLAGRTVYPLHVGITESGTVNSGNIKSAIGLSLISVGVNSFGGGNAAKDFGSAENLLLAVFVLVVILFFKHWTTGFLSSSSILIGIVAGYLAAIVMGFVLPTTGVTADGVEFTKAWVLNWNKVAEASWFAIPKLVPVKIVFDLRAILPVMIMFIVTAVETVGDISGVMEGGMSREATDKELSGGIICDGLGSTVAACFGVLPNTSFSQNVGLVAMTKVVNRGALATGAIFLMLCGLIPKLGALISIMPQAVLGGAAVMMFSSIVVSGIQLITKEKMTPRTLTIVSVALGVGYGMGANAKILANTPQFVQLICGESGIVPAAFVAILLNCLLPRDEK